jgi:predicted nucleotidyltransferase
MVTDPKAVMRLVNQYVADVKTIIPIDKAYLYGSYARGTQRKDSDIDICFFSESFDSIRSVDIISRLLGIARQYNRDIYIEPRGLPTSELNNDNPFVKEILRTGLEL